MSYIYLDKIFKNKLLKYNTQTYREYQYTFCEFINLLNIRLQICLKKVLDEPPFRNLEPQSISNSFFSKKLIIIFKSLGL